MTRLQTIQSLFAFSESTMVFVILQMVVDMWSLSVPQFLGTGDITYEDEFRFRFF